jgi:outer membrane protein
MNKLTMMATAIGAVALSTPALAGDPAGRWQVKIMGSAVLPDGKIDKVLVDPGLPAGTDTKADDNYVPTAAIEYFFSPNISVETICCLTQHDVDVATGPLKSGQLVADRKIIPATLTVKLHLPTRSGLKPYVGAGPAYFIFFDEKPGEAARSLLGATKLAFNDKIGVALQAGVDMPLGRSGFGLSFDAKRYWVRPTAHWSNASGTEVLATRHKLDPWVLSAGVGYRF